MNYLFPRGAIDISVYFENSSVHAILSSSGGVMKGELCGVLLLVIRGVTEPAMLVY